MTRLLALLLRPFASIGWLLPVLALVGLWNDGGDGGDGDGGGDGGDGQDGGDGDGDGQDSGDADKGGKTGGDGKTFSQAELDEIIGKRLAREKSKWENETKQAAERAKLDETERAKAEKADAEKAASDAKTKADERVITAEARVAAIAAGVKKEQLAYVLRLADLSGVEVDDEGNPDVKAIDKAITKVLTDVPALKATGNGAGRSGGDLGGGGPTKPKTLEEAVNSRLAATG